jgi:N-methylhydantoinase A
MTGFRVGVDIGGTFTDIVFLGADGTLHTKKISSSVRDYAQAIADWPRRTSRSCATAPRSHPTPSSSPRAPGPV